MVFNFPFPNGLGDVEYHLSLFDRSGTLRPTEVGEVM